MLKKYFLFIFGLFFLFFFLNNVSATFCYQESANTINQGGIDGSCGLNYGGSYSFSILGDFISPTNANDGNWNSLTYCNNNLGVHNITVVYIKPQGATGTSVLQVQDGFADNNGGSLTKNTIVNLSIPSSAWTYSATNVTFLVQISSTTGTCFLENTTVTMADGSYKNIQDVKVGDSIKSLNTSTGEIVNETIMKLYHNTPSEMAADYYLVINDIMKVTPNHIIPVNGRWIQIKNAKIGDWLVNEKGQKIYITSIKKVYQRVPTYTFEVSNTHNFFADGILVHNASPGSLDGDTEVATLNGNESIKDITYGTKIYSYNLVTNRKELDTVVNKTIQNLSSEGGIFYAISYEKIIFSLLGFNIYGNPQLIKATPEHLFYLSNNIYVKAENLTIGEKLLDYNLKEVKIVDIKKISDNNSLVYDITTKNNHNFFANGVLVHNLLPGGGKQVEWNVYDGTWIDLRDSPPAGVACSNGQVCSGSVYEEAMIWSGTFDTCTYSGSGDWNIHIQDNCILNTDTNLPSNNIIFSGGGGTVLINSTIQARNILFAPTTLNKLSMIWINKVNGRLIYHK